VSVTDQAILGEIQDSLGDTNNSGASWSSGEWTAGEVIALTNQRQRQFLRETGVVLTQTTITTNPNILRHNLPTDWVATRRVAWLDVLGNVTSIPSGDNFEMDLFRSDWPYNQDVTTPRIYSDADQANLILETAPAIASPGVLNFLYVALSALLSNSGVLYTVPDECVPAIKWGVVADMLSKVGRAHDPLRAQWAEDQYREGVEATKIVLKGWA
jgi:hypothetical protein